MATICQYFLRTPNDFQLLIDFSELLLVLLRDDCVFVRNAASDIVVSLTQNDRSASEGTKKGTSASHMYWQKLSFYLNSHFAVIPLVAEDYLLRWLSGIFTKFNGQSSWQQWLELIKMIQMNNAGSEESDENDGEIDLNEATNGDDSVDIFEANEINMFGETVYISYKCYQHLMQSINASGKDADEIAALKKHIYSELPALRDF